ncbi:MAG: helix-turn-helix transcriptional regulator [Muribaculaceae bacterium]|nr:helix-turn-helix transcriptional regulator [Muribaculaceae bacterium]
MPIPNATILIINIISILFLLGLSALLLFTRKHTKADIPLAVTVITTTIPIYVYNIFFTCGWYILSLWIAPFAYTSGIAFLPALWLFVHRYFNSGEKFKKIRLIHFLPAVACFLIYTIYILLLSFPERLNFLLYKSTYMSRWIEIINISVIAVQAIIYFSIILIYMSRVKAFIGKHYTETEWARNMWIPKTLYFIAAGYTTLIICHHIWKNDNTWLLNALDVIAMLYFTYSILKSSQDKHTSSNNPIAEIQFDSRIEEVPVIDNDKSVKYAGIIDEYLKSSKIYLNPVLTLKDVSDSTGISCNDISQAIQKAYGSSFFDYINKLRIDRAIRTLNNDTAHEQNIDTITFQSGFSSRSAFHTAFKKNIGKTPAQYLEETGNKTVL